jgi:hypothetical protein
MGSIQTFLKNLKKNDICKGVSGPVLTVKKSLKNNTIQSSAPQCYLSAVGRGGDSPVPAVGSAPPLHQTRPPESPPPAGTAGSAGTLLFCFSSLKKRERSCPRHLYTVILLYFWLKPIVHF